MPIRVHACTTITHEAGRPLCIVRPSILVVV